jgi:hypothetical protein
MSPSKVGRHRAGNGNDFSVRRLTGGDRLVYNSVKFEECTRREAGFFVAVSRKQTECVMNDSPLLCQFRISAAMRSYVLRVRLRGTDFEFGSEPEQAVAYTKCIREMRRILVDKRRRVPAIAADRAILKSLEAAFDFQSAHLRYRFLKTMEGQSQTTLDHLIRGLRQLSNAIARLPPNKGLRDRAWRASLAYRPFPLKKVGVARIATIWRTLGLNPGLAYDFFVHPANDHRIRRGGRVESAFQRYCRSALSAVGDFTKISARQVDNYKRNKRDNEIMSR